MSTLVKTKRRINSVANTRKITNAMELVASVKLKRYKNVMENGINYVKSIEDIINYVSPFLDEEEKILTNETSKRLFIIINSNLGLCASYNNDVYKFVEENVNKDDEILPIGLKGYTHYHQLNLSTIDKYVSINEKINIEDVNCLAKFLLESFEKKTYQEINIIYTDYLNTITFKPIIKTLLPIKFNKEKKDLLPPIIEPNPRALINELMPIYLSSMIYQCLVISQVSEQASRHNAMKNATDNADDLLEKLKLEYNKVRQSTITQEITEVVTGSNY